MWEFHAQKADRLDRILREQNISPWMSRQAWEKALAAGWVKVNGKTAKKPGEQVGESSLISVHLPALGLEAEGPSPRLIWESPDASLAVFYKEAGVPTYPLYPWERGTLANGILAYAKEKGLPFAELAAPPSLEGGLLQRLDRDTSGLVTVAFTSEAKAFYRKVFSGEANKGYWAIVSGCVEGTHRVFFPQSSAPKVVARTSAREGDAAVELTAKILARTPAHSLLEVHTTQGLRHVVRAGLATLGAPLVGDVLYGGSEEMPFHQLHAYSLQIPGFAQITASAPQSFLDCLEDLGLNYPG